MREDGIYGTEHEHEPLPLALNEASRLLVFCRRCRGRDGLAKKFSRPVISGITDLMSGGVVAKNNLTHYALVFGQMRFLDEVIIGVVFVLQDKSKLFLWPKNFTTKKPSALIQIPANFFAHLSILARSSGDSFVTGRIGLVDSARAISVKDNADANIAAVLLGEGTERCGGESKEEGGGDATHGSKRSGGGN